MKIEQPFDPQEEGSPGSDDLLGDSPAPPAPYSPAADDKNVHRDRFHLEELETIYETAPVGLCVFDTELRFVRINQRLAEINGVPAADHIGRTPREVVPDLADVAERLFNRVLETGEPIHNVEIAGYTPARPGVLRTWLEHFNPLFDENGQVVGINVTVEEITERKQMEEALRAREAELRELSGTLEKRVAERTEALARSGEALLEARDRFFTLFHASPVPTNLTALEDGTILDANSAYLGLFKLGREQVVARKSGELARIMNAREEEQAQVRALIEQQGRAANVEMHLTTADGQERVMLVSTETTTLEGRPVAITTLSDVTERVEAQQQVLRLATDLSRAEELERKRIAQILHDDIQQMVVAWQIQSELGATGGEEGLRETLAVAGDYAAQILEKLRDLSMELSMPGSKTDSLAEALAWIRQFMGERYGLEVQLDTAREVDVTNLDLRALVLRLVRELLFNVVKHAGTGRARVEAQLEGDDLVLRVTDGGRGFNPEILEAYSDATGFGLKGMGDRLQLLGGHLEIASAPGEGTEVTLTLPNQIWAPQEP